MIPVAIVTKFAIETVATIGVSKVVGDIVKNHVVVNTTTQKVVATVGRVVIGSMVASVTSKHVNEQMSSFVNARKNRKEKKNPTDNVEDLTQAA